MNCYTTKYQYPRHFHGLIDALVGHVPIEISQFLNYFLTTGEDENYFEAEVLRKRKREIGLVVPAKYKATAKDKRFANILREKLEEKKRILNIDILDSEVS